MPKKTPLEIAAQRATEKQKFEEFYQEPPYPENEEPIVCANGFSEDDWCDPESNRGVEYCEFCCPWNLLSNEAKESEAKP